MKILEILRENPQISAPEMAKILDLTTDGIHWNMNKLKKQGIIRHTGPDKGGSWEILKKMGKSSELN